MSAIDAAANVLGRSQYGLVARRQFREAGIDARAIRRRLDTGAWAEAVPQVIDLGTHPPSWRQGLMRIALATLAIRRLEAILWEAARRDPGLPLAVAGVLARHRRARGRRGLRALLADLHPQVAELASPLEVNGVLALQHAGAPAPVLQHVVRDDVGRFAARVDAAWLPARVIAEFDGAAYHDHPRARQHDERRLAGLRSLGWEVHVLTARDLRRPARLRRVVERIRARTR